MMKDSNPPPKDHGDGDKKEIMDANNNKTNNANPNEEHEEQQQQQQEQQDTTTVAGDNSSSERTTTASGNNSTSSSSSSFATYVVSDHPDGYGVKVKRSSNNNNYYYNHHDTSTGTNGGGAFDALPLSDFDATPTEHLQDDEETVLLLKKQVKNMNLILKKIHEIQERDLTQSLMSKRKVYRSDQILLQQDNSNGSSNGSSGGGGGKGGKNDSEEDFEYDEDLDLDSDSGSFGLPTTQGGVSGDGVDDCYKADEDVQGNIPMTSSHSEELLRKELSEIDKLLGQLTIVVEEEDCDGNNSKTSRHHPSSGRYAYDLQADIMEDFNRITTTLTNAMSKFPFPLLSLSVTDNITNNHNGGDTVAVHVAHHHEDATAIITNGVDDDVDPEEAEISKEDQRSKNKKKKKLHQSSRNEELEDDPVVEEDDERHDQEDTAASVIDITNTTATKKKRNKDGSSIVVISKNNNNTRDLRKDDDHCRDGVAATTPEDDDAGNGHGDIYCSYGGGDNHNDDIFPTSMIDCTAITMTFLACSDYLGVGNCPGGGSSSSKKSTDGVDGDGGDDFVVSSNSNNRNNSKQQPTSMNNSGKQTTTSTSVLDSTDISRFQVMANKAIDDMTQKAIAVCGSPRNERDGLGTPYSLTRNSVDATGGIQQSEQSIDDLLLHENKSSDSRGRDNDDEYIQQPSLSTISEHYSRENLSMSITPRDTNRTPSPVLPTDHHQRTNTHDRVEINDGDDQISKINEKEEAKIGLQVADDLFPSNDLDMTTEDTTDPPSDDGDDAMNDPPKETSADVVTPLPTHFVPNIAPEEPPAINQRPTASSGSDGRDVIDTPKQRKEEIVNLLEMPTLDCQQRRTEDGEADTGVNDDMDLIENDIPQISLKRRIRRPSEDIAAAAAAADASSSTNDKDQIDGLHLKVATERHVSSTNSSEADKSVQQKKKGTRNNATDSDTDEDAVTDRLTATNAIHIIDLDIDNDKINEVPSDEGLSSKPIMISRASQRLSSSSLKVNTTTTKMSSTASSSKNKKKASNKSPSPSPSSFSLQKYSPLNAASSPRASFSARYGSLNPSPRRSGGDIYIWQQVDDADNDTN